MFTSVANATWDMVFVRSYGRTHIIVHGPETAAAQAPVPPDAEMFGITFKTGVFMPHLQLKFAKDHHDIALPSANANTFWLHGSTWEIPTIDNADVFVQRLMRANMLVQDDAVVAVLQGQPTDLSRRSMQYRFVRATGISHKTIQQIERAHQAVAQLQAGHDILTTALDLGFYDQAHFSNALKRFIGHTPSEIVAAPSLA